MTSLLQHMCKTADHRSGTDLEAFVVNQVQTSTEPAQIDILPLEDVKTQIYRIEQRERLEYDRVFTLIGPPPTDEAPVVEESVAPSSVSGSTQATPAPKVQTPAPKTTDKKKPRKSKKDLPESVKNKLTNSAALMAAGGTMKAWMLPSTPALASAPPKKKSVSKVVPRMVGPTVTPSNPMRTSRTSRTAKRITLKDALFTMEQMRSLKGSSTYYKWWANVK